MIKINLVSEGKGPRSGGASAAAGAMTEAAPGDLNNKIVAALAIVGLLLAGAYWFIYNTKVNAKEATAVERRDEAQKLESIIAEVERFKQRKVRLEERINLINDLKRNQKMPVRVMDQISRNLPDLVWVDQMSVTGRTIELQGRALNENAIALFIEQVKNDPLFLEPNTKELTRQGNGNVFRYVMTFDYVLPPMPGEGEEAEVADAA